MSTIAKIFAVIVLVLAIAMTSGVVVYLRNAADYKSQLATTKDELAKAVKLAGEDRVAMAKEIEGLKADKTKADTEVKDITAKVGDLDVQLKLRETDLTTQKGAYERLSAAVTGIQAQLAQLQKENGDLLNQKEDYRLKFEAAGGDKKKAEDDLMMCKEALRISEESLKQMKAQLVEAQGALTSQKEAVPALVFERVKPEMPEIVGKVLNVDPQTSLVQISVGKDDGVKEGYAFEVVHSNPDRYVGRIWIVKVDDEFAYGKIDPAMTKGGQIMENDYVTTRLQ